MSEQVLPAYTKTQDEIQQALKTAHDAEIKEEKFEEALSQEPFIIFSGLHKEIFYDDKKGAYYRLDGSKNRVYYTESNFLHDFKEDNDCFGTQVNLSGDLCKDWALMILNEKEEPKFMELLGEIVTKGDFFNVTKTALSQMHPLMALSILKKFGFRKSKQYDGKAGMSLYKVEAVHHWLKHVVNANSEPGSLKAHLSTPGFDNTKKYLALVREYVNCNPGILNHDYTGPTAEQYGDFTVPEDAAKYGLKKPTAGEKANYVALCNMGMNQQFFSGGPGSIYNPATHSLIGGGNMSGGHGNPFMLSPFGTQTFTPGLPLFRETRKLDKPMCKAIKFQAENQGHAVIQSVFNAIKSSLATKYTSKGKDIPADIATALAGLPQKIDNYKSIQHEIIRTLCALETFAKYSDQLPSHMSLKAFNKIVDRLNKLSGKGFTMDNYFLSMFGKMLMLEEESGEYVKM